jgi:hypothetical protein
MVSRCLLVISGSVSVRRACVATASPLRWFQRCDFGGVQTCAKPPRSGEDMAGVKSRLAVPAVSIGRVEVFVATGGTIRLTGPAAGSLPRIAR